MHVASFVEHPDPDEQCEAPDKTKDIKMNVVIPRHDFFITFIEHIVINCVKSERLRYKHAHKHTHITAISWTNA